MEKGKLQNNPRPDLEPIYTYDSNVVRCHLFISSGEIMMVKVILNSSDNRSSTLELCSLNDTLVERILISNIPLNHIHFLPIKLDVCYTGIYPTKNYSLIIRVYFYKFTLVNIFSHLTFCISHCGVRDRYHNLHLSTNPVRQTKHSDNFVDLQKF